MAKFGNVCALLLVLLGTFSFCHGGIEDTLLANADKLLKNRAVVQKQTACVVQRGPCDNLGNNIKSLLNEVIGNNCRRCTPQQKSKVDRLVATLRRDYPSEWSALSAKYPNFARSNG